MKNVETFHKVGLHVTIFPYLFLALLEGFLATSQDVFMLSGKSFKVKWQYQNQ